MRSVRSRWGSSAMSASLQRSPSDRAPRARSVKYHFDWLRGVGASTCSRAPGEAGLAATSSLSTSAGCLDPPVMIVRVDNRYTCCRLILPSRGDGRIRRVHAGPVRHRLPERSTSSTRRTSVPG